MEENEQLIADIRAEEAVMGILLGYDAATVIRRLSATDFQRPAHRLIFDAAAAVFEHGTVEPITVGSELATRGQLEEVGGHAFLEHLVLQVYEPQNAERYIAAVRDMAAVRHISDASQRALREIQDGRLSATDLLGSLERDILSIGETAHDSEMQRFDTIAREHYAHLGEPDFGMEHVSSGFHGIDHYLVGFSPSLVYVLAARPGVGKTSLALDIAKRVALSGDGAVLFFSLEMSKSELIDRVASSSSGVVSQSLRSGNVSSDELQRVCSATQEMESVPFYIDDNAHLTFPQMRAVVKQFAAKQHVALVIVDYVQLMQYDTATRVESREREVANLSRSFKGLAKDMGVPILAISQLNREVEARKDKKPQLSDLRESGAIEQDADVVCFLWPDPEDPLSSFVSCIIAKNRFGPVGVAGLHFDRHLTKFTDVSASYLEEGDHKQCLETPQPSTSSPALLLDLES